MHLTVYQCTVSHISFSAHTFFARLREQHQTSDDAVRSLPSTGIVFEDWRDLRCAQQVPDLRPELGLEQLHLLLFEPAELMI